MVPSDLSLVTPALKYESLFEVVFLNARSIFVFELYHPACLDALPFPVPGIF